MHQSIVVVSSTWPFPATHRRAHINLAQTPAGGRSPCVQLIAAFTNPTPVGYI